MVTLKGFLSLAGLLSLASISKAAVSAIEPYSFIRGAYIVEFEAGVDDESAFFRQLRRQGLAATKRKSFDSKLFKGVSFQVDEAIHEVHEDTSLFMHARIARIDIVKNVWPVAFISPENTPKSGNETTPNAKAHAKAHLSRRDDDDKYTDYSPQVQTQVDKLHAEGFTGKGITIGIVDSGTDYKHPALGGCFGKGCLVAQGYDYVGDDYTGATSTPKPDDDPYTNCDSHGTHVAGIVAAQENPIGFRGAAYGATIGSYRVTSCSGSTSTDLIMKGMLGAADDGVDIITISIRGVSGWNEDPLNVVSQRIVESGIVVVGGAGNDAAMYYSMFAVGSPAGGLGATSVGSVNTKRQPLSVEVASYETDRGSNSSFLFQSGLTVFRDTITRPIWLVNSDRSPDGFEICGPLPDETPDLSKFIVLVEINDKCGNDWDTSEYLKAKGAEYILFYEPVERQNVAFCDAVLGCGTVTLDQAKEWRSLLEGGTDVEVHILPYEDTEHVWRYFAWGDNRGEIVNDFSSWGPTWDLDPEIDVLGVGGTVLSTLPGNTYGYESGTSMSTPLVAGIYALLMEATKLKDPTALRSLLQSTATQYQWNDYKNPVTALAPVPQQGAGLVQAYDAWKAPVLITPSSLSFNDSDFFVKKVSISLENRGNQDVTYQVGHSWALTVYSIAKGSTDLSNGPYESAADAHATLDFSSKSITVPAGGKTQLEISPTAPTGLAAKQLPVYSGFVTLNSTDKSKSNLVIPYLGVAASMKNDPTYLVASDTHLLDNNTRSEQPANTTFQSPGNLPAVHIQNKVGTPLYRIDVLPMFGTVDKVPTKVVDGLEIAGNVDFGEYSAAFGATAWWNGTVADGKTSKKLPQGSYAFIVRALRMRGDRAQKDDWVILKTDPFNLEYVSEKRD